MAAFSKSSQFVIIGLLLLSFMSTGAKVDGLLSFMLLLPLITFKLGLAAPLVLLLVCKILILLLKKKMLLGALLISQAKNKLGSGELANLGGDGGLLNLGGILNSISSLGRIKRSTTSIMDEVLSQIEIDEEQLIEAIYNLDTKRCGEKLMCEVAASQKKSKKQKMTEDELALFSLFTNKELLAKSSNRAVRVYKKALINGFLSNDCSTRYPSCPFKRDDMLDIFQLITSEDFFGISSKFTSNNTTTNSATTTSTTTTENPLRETKLKEKEIKKTAVRKSIFSFF